MPPPSFADDHPPDFFDDEQRGNPAPIAEEPSSWPKKSVKKKKKKYRQHAPEQLSDNEQGGDDGQRAEMTLAPEGRPPPTTLRLSAAPFEPVEVVVDPVPPPGETGGRNSPSPEWLTQDLEPARSIPKPQDPPPEPLPMTISSPSEPQRRANGALAPGSTVASMRSHSASDNSQSSGTGAGVRNSNGVALQAARSPRRESFGVQTSRSRFVEPPPPHMPQAHFFGLPDLLDLGQKKAATDGKLAGSDGYCCVFDTLADSGDSGSSKKTKEILLVGSEGGIDVYRVLPNKLEVVGHLEGLRGSVIGAKILPQVQLLDPFPVERPLIAVVVHGPAAELSRRKSLADDGTEDTADGLGPYQTSVEVYSLRTQRHVATLYKSTLVAVKPPSIGQLTSLPSPVGQLSVEAKGKFVVVASGKSGEIFVFSAVQGAVHSEPAFRCIGKYWTSLQVPLDNSRRPSSRDGPSATDTRSNQPNVPLFSLSQRWLALVCPPTSSNSSILGSPVLSDQSSSPVGLTAHVSPPPPPVTCDVVGIDEEGTLGRLTRQAAQGIVKYSQKGLELGWQGWKEFTNPDPQAPTQSQHARTPSDGHSQFPPTKAPPDDSMQTTIEPAVVAIVDLDSLLETEEIRGKHVPPPLATFALSAGCNFVSFSSSGLRLLTVSRSGEVSTIWDISRALHGSLRHNGVDAKELQGPYVKHMFRIPRSSQSVVVEASWTRDDDALALLTTHGTIHLHDVPSNAPSRKRRRRSTFNGPVPDKAQPTVSLSSGLSPPSSNGLLGTIKSSWQQVSTGVNTIRSQNPVANLGLPITFAGFKEVTASAGQAGGRLVAKGISQGYIAAKGGASDYWHAEDNKIRHKALTGLASQGSLRWIRRQSGTLFAVVCGGTVHLYSIVRTTRRKGDLLVAGLKHERGAKHFPLQTIRTRDEPLDSLRADDCTGQGPHGFWTLRSPDHIDATANTVHFKASAHTSPPENDVETNPPYCPFHVDPRVNFYALDPDANFSLRGHGYDVENSLVIRDGGYDDPYDEHVLNDDSSPLWLFGAPLPPAAKLTSHGDDANGLTYQREYLDSDDELALQVESRLTVRSVGNSDGGGDAGGGARREDEICVRSAPAARDLDEESEEQFGIVGEL